MTELVGVDRFLEDPRLYFNYSLTQMMSLPRSDTEHLQLQALQTRFRSFRGKLPMLDKLADAQDIDAIGRIEDVVPLLFNHAVYKSYPSSLLDNHRYTELTRWLNKLTTIDLSALDVSECKSIDDWMIALRKETPLTPVHTSGTTGSLSLIPSSKKEWLKWVKLYTTQFFQRFGDPAPAVPPALPLNIDCIYPYYRSGCMSHTVANDAIAQMIAGSEERFHAAYPGRLSADMMLLAARYRAAVAKGQLDRLHISPELAARRDQFEADRGQMANVAASFFGKLSRELKGRQVFMQATSNLLLTVAQDGLRQGLRGVFAPNSVIITGGGGKGMVLPADWQTPVKEFFGVDRLQMVYGMTECVGVSPQCEHGNYHTPPWVIPFILDPDTSKLIPRTGTTTGRYALYDLMAETRWGGFVSGDEVTMVWDAPCPCGQTTSYLTGPIQRLSERRAEGAEDKLSCAATPQAYEEALAFLNADADPTAS